jgi:hydroxyacylglutathione hydrolase
VVKFDWFPVTRFEQNCSILWCESTHKAAVIDPGGDLTQITDFLEWEELQLEVVLVTHGHFDHAGGVAELAAATGARVEGPHRGDEHLLTQLRAQGERYGVRSQIYSPDRWLEHGDQIRFGDECLEVLHCPGHTSGHVAYFSARQRFAFVGDILFRHAIGAWDHSDGDLKQLVRSIRLNLFSLGDDVRFLPGHGEPSSIHHERHANPFVGDAAMAKWTARFGKIEG